MVEFYTRAPGLQPASIASHVLFSNEILVTKTNGTMKASFKGKLTGFHCYCQCIFFCILDSGSLFMEAVDTQCLHRVNLYTFVSQNTP